jgi:hypothetical protein
VKRDTLDARWFVPVAKAIFQGIVIFGVLRRRLRLRLLFVVNTEKDNNMSSFDVMGSIRFPGIFVSISFIFGATKFTSRIAHPRRT